MNSSPGGKVLNIKVDQHAIKLRSFIGITESASTWLISETYPLVAPCTSETYSKNSGAEGEPDDRVTKKNRYLVKRVSNTNE